MSDRVYASIFYIAMIIGSSWTAVTLGEALTREALSKLALLPSHAPHPSRVDVFLAEQDRNQAPQNAKEPLIPAAPAMTVGALAKGMDDAERIDGDQGKAEGAATEGTSGVPDAEKPRVAGWVKRLPKHTLPASVPEETSSHIIMRSLRAEM